MIHPFENTLKKLEEFGMFTESEEIQKDEFLLWVEQNLKESAYMNFIKLFNKETGKRYQGDINSRELFYASSSLYNFKEFEIIIKNALTDPYVINDKPGIMRPEFILKSENLAKYLNYKAPKKTKQISGDYNEIDI